MVIEADPMLVLQYGFSEDFDFEDEIQRFEFRLDWNFDWGNYDFIQTFDFTSK